MEERIAKLEQFAAITNERLARIEALLALTATKADLADLKAEMHRNANDLIRWMVGTAVGLGVAGITVITFVLNNAMPKAPLPPTTPITINTQPLNPPTAPAPSRPSQP